MRHAIKLKSFAITAALFAASASIPGIADAEPVIPLYPKAKVPSLGVPEIREQRAEAGGLLIRNVSEPTLEIFRPVIGGANGTAVIVAPGGGFVGLAYDAEGVMVARALAQRGVTAFLLKYRTIRSDPDPMSMPEVHMKEMDVIMARAKSGVPVEVPRFAGEPHAIEDGERALAIVRQRASEWGIDPRRVGVLGFSAGAYLAADLAIGDKASRPNFVGLIYGGLRTPVPADASPAFIAAAADDEYQPNDAALLFTAWREAGVTAELHIYARGGHGFGMTPKGTTSDRWLDEFIVWLKSRESLREGTANPH